jgi:hypothetical protein
MIISYNLKIMKATRERRAKQLMKREWEERNKWLKHSKTYWFDWLYYKASRTNNEEGA